MVRILCFYALSINIYTHIPHTHTQRARALLEGLEAALAPLSAQLAAVEHIPPPDFNTYNAWLLNEVAVQQRLTRE